MSVRSIEISRQQAEELVDLIEQYSMSPTYELAAELREKFGMAQAEEGRPVLSRPIIASKVIAKVLTKGLGEMSPAEKFKHFVSKG